MYKVGKRKRRAEIENDLKHLESLNLLSGNETIQEEFQAIAEKYK